MGSVAVIRVYTFMNLDEAKIYFKLVLFFIYAKYIFSQGYKSVVI